MPAPKVSLSKQANPLRGPAAKTVQMALKKMLGGLKTYGKRLTGDSTLKPLYAKRNLMWDLDETLRKSRRPLSDEIGPLKVLNQATRAEHHAQTALRRELLSDKGNAAYERWRAAMKNNDQQLLASGGELGPRGSTWARERKSVPGTGISGEISKLLEQSRKNIVNESDAISKTRRYTGGAAAGATLGGIGTAAYNNSKQSAALPEPTSRGQTKKVTVPESSSQQPDLDPEGVQMTEQDHKVKNAFMGVGALAGMATAPNKEEEDLSIGRGALRGVGTGLGVGTGAITGGLAGGLGGAGLGAILGALARGKYQRLGDAVSNGVAGGAGMGMLAGGLAGGAYGGYKGNKATKALLDKTVPMSDKKKDKKDDDDKDVKEAAAAVLAQVQKHAADTPTPRAYSSVSTGQTQGGAPPGAYSGKVSVPVDSRPQNPIPRMPFAGRLPDVTLDEAETVNRYAGNPSIRAGYPTEQNFVPNRILVPAPAGTGEPSRKDVATAARQVARTAASPAASPHSPSRVEAQFGSPEFMRLRKKFR